MASSVGSASSTSRRGTLTACPNCRTVSRVGTPTPFEVDDDVEAPFKVDDRVEARFKGRKHFYPGKITAVHVDGDTITYDIEYDDGDEDWGLDARYVSPAIDSDEGDDDDGHDKAIEDAGLKGEKNVNPVDANGQPIPKPGY